MYIPVDTNIYVWLDVGINTVHVYACMTSYVCVVVSDGFLQTLCYELNVTLSQFVKSNR